MDARLLDGASVAKTMMDKTRRRVEQIVQLKGVTPCLATMLVGSDPASVTYVKMKQNRCRKVGIDSRHIELPESSTTEEVVAAVTALSNDPTVQGILLQHPVPRHVDERAAFEAIAPTKDVDGVTMQSFASMAMGAEGFASCTPGGIIDLLDAYRLPIAGKHAVVIGRSPILGKPVGMLLLGRDATVTYCHSRTQGIVDIVRTADIVVAAVGKAEFVKGDWIKPGAVVLDAGYNEGNVGDVDFNGARTKASHITPVPGGVGPMTIAVLLKQTVQATERQFGLNPDNGITLH